MQIFISYSRIDRAFAQRLNDDLIKNQYQVWLDLQNIPHGANWDLEVQRGLDGSETMLVLLSPPAVASQNVADEWSYFIDKNKRIIPLLIQPCDVPFRLSRRQRIDFIQGYDLGLTELLRALKEPTLTVGDSPHAANTDIISNAIPVSWAENYQLWSGLRPTPITGSAMVTPSELRLMSPQRLPFLLPLTSLVSVQKKHLPWDTYLNLTYLDRADHTHSLAIMGTKRAVRQSTDDELLSLLKLYSGRALS